MIEIRWHGRGGQGVKTAALIFGEVNTEAGKYIQAFPEYGPERMGAPVCAFNRISDRPISLYCAIQSPDIVVVVDESLISEGLKGLSPGKTLIVNTKEDPATFRKKHNIDKGIKLFTIDASGISLETIKKDIPNTPMLSALTRVCGASLDALIFYTEKKLGKKKEVLAGNIEAIKRAYNEIKCE